MNPPQNKGFKMDIGTSEAEKIADFFKSAARQIVAAIIFHRQIERIVLC